MANTKTPPKKPVTQKGKAASPPPPKGSSRLVSIILLAAAVLWLSIALVEGAGVWLAVHTLMLNLFGFCSYVGGLLLLLLSFLVALDKSIVHQAPRILGAALFMLLCGAALHIFGNDESYLLDEAILTQTRDAWGAQNLSAGGGFFGALIGAALGKLGKTPAGIVVILTLLILLMLLTGTSHLIWLRFLARNAKRAKGALDVRAQALLEREEAREQTRVRVAEVPLEPLKPLEPFGRGKGKKRFDPPPLPADIPPEAGNSYDDFILPTLDSEPPPVCEPIPEVFPIPPRRKKERAAPPPAQTEAPPEKEAAQETPEPEDSAVYRLPALGLLNVTPPSNLPASGNVQTDVTGQKLIETLNSFNVSAEIIAISRGPSVTRYELEPSAGVRISRITQLADDIALRLASAGVRIEAPIPNKSAIGIEVPNKQKSMVGMREIIGSDLYKNAKSRLTVALGKDITGNIITADLSKMPHLLIAGTTGSGKSVCMNTMIISLLYNALPDEVKLIMIDPKQVEFTVYNGIAHLLMPVVTDPRKAAGALAMAVGEMQKRYKLFSEHNVRDITGFNKLAQNNPELKSLERIVIFIDELSDLMMVAPNEVEDSICRLAQMARAAGMHLVIATQRPSVDVITGIIKANIPSRIALSVSSQIDSRTILDMAGAEKLLGYGDMLFNPVGMSKPVRVQGCFISDSEVEDVTDFIRNQLNAEYNEAMMDEMEKNALAAGQKKKGAAAVTGGEEDGEVDELFHEAVRVVVEAEMASTTLLQRKLKLGYARASRVMDELEEHGIVGPHEGSKPRKVLITKQQFMEMRALGDDDYAAAAQEEPMDDGLPFDVDEEPIL